MIYQIFLQIGSVATVLRDTFFHCIARNFPSLSALQVTAFLRHYEEPKTNEANNGGCCLGLTMDYLRKPTGHSPMSPSGLSLRTQSPSLDELSGLTSLHVIANPEGMWQSQ